MIWYINVNRNTIFRNAKRGLNEPPISIQKGKWGKRTYHHRIKIKEGELIYSPHQPILKCGARLIIETNFKPEIVK